MKNMEHDGIGFITGRGLSQYWGVSKQINQSGGKDPWVVKFADPYIAAGLSNRYRVLVAKDFILREDEAAKIAAYFHSNPMPFANYPIKIVFECANNKYQFVVDTRKKTITREANMSTLPGLAMEEKHKRVIGSPVKEDFYTKPSMLADILAQDEKKVVVLPKLEETEYNKGFAAGFALNEIIRNKLGEHGLKTILEAVEKRLKEKQ